MTVNVPVLPIAGATVLRAALALIALLVDGMKRLVRARRHRRQALELAKFDGHMLADIGITRADLRDAFSGSFWEDPTAILTERANDRRRHRSRGAPRMKLIGECGFRRPPTDRPARQTV